jgi:hypothetical protein
MKKIILTTLTTIGTLTFSFSQDVITKKSGEDIQAKILEVAQNEIKYKKFDNQNGPSFSIAKSDILIVRYQNGTKDVFSDATKSTETTSVSSIDMRAKARQDAMTNYKGKKSGAGWTAATSIVLSPILGLIPAIACSSSEPNEDNLNYMDSELMKDNTYNQAYREQAHKTKKKKIWTNYGIGSGVWLLLIILF